MCRGAFGDDGAVLEGLAGAQFELHRVGAVADRPHPRSAVEGVLEEDRGFVTYGGLGDNVAGAGDIARFELLDACHPGEYAPVADADLLEELQVDGVVDVAVRVEVPVADLEPCEGGRVLHGGVPFLWVSAEDCTHPLRVPSDLMRTMDYDEYLEQGETLASEGLVEEALWRFEQALEAAPENPEVIEAVGRALLNLGRLEGAEASFLDALELDPEWVAPRMGLAMVALRPDEPFKIVHHLERAMEADPEYPDAYVELGRYYGAMAEPALAKATFERWTSRHPEDADMLINAGLTAFDAADYAQAYAFFEKATEAALVEEQKSGARTFRANTLDMLGRYDEAVEAYEEVIAETPEWWEAHANLGICHARNGQSARAEAAFRRGLEDCPGSPEIRDELAAHLLSERKNLD